MARTLVAIDKAGPLIRELREAAGLSQRDLAERTDGVVSCAGISRLETGERRLGFKMAEALSKALPIRVVVEYGRAVVAVDNERGSTRY